METPFKIPMVDHHVPQKSLPSTTKRVPCRSQTIYQDAFHVLSMISIEVWGLGGAKNGLSLISTSMARVAFSIL